MGGGGSQSARPTFFTLKQISQSEGNTTENEWNAKLILFFPRQNVHAIYMKQPKVIKILQIFMKVVALPAFSFLMDSNIRISGIIWHLFIGIITQSQEI